LSCGGRREERADTDPFDLGDDVPQDARCASALDRSEALRHLGIAAHGAGRLDEARERLEESSRLSREVGAMSGVASNMIGLAYIAAAQDRRADALAMLDEAHAIANAHGAHAILRHIEQARTHI
jgi:hypothetical protein